MKVEKFVSELKSNSPSVSDLLQRGYSESFSNEITTSYTIKKKNKDSVFKDELLELIDSYDVSNLKIGLIHFHSSIDQRADFYIVGEVEADLLAVDKITGIIKVLDFYTEKEISLCATNGSKFLDAILQVSNFIAKSTLFEVEPNNQNILCTLAEECSAIAGGNMFVQFYKDLIGCFE